VPEKPKLELAREWKIKRAGPGANPLTDVSKITVYFRKPIEEPMDLIVTLTPD
jgi:hypothetical protein